MSLLEATLAALIDSDVAGSRRVGGGRRDRVAIGLRSAVFNLVRMSTKILSSNRLLAATFLLGLAVAACSASNPGTNGSSPPATGSGPGASTPVAASTMTFIDACALINQADAQALFKEPLGTYSAFANGQCNWPVANTSKNASLDIDVETGPDVTTRLVDVMGSFVNNKPLSGVGDQAMWEVNGVNPTLGAVKGEVSCEISGDGDNTSFATTVNGNPPFDEIDSAALPGFMAKFGTLCNDIFASLGDTTGQAPATNPPVASSTTGTGVDVCALLPAAQVAQITGFTIIGSSPHSSPVIANAFGCTYQFGVTVDLETSGGAADYDAEVARYATNAIPIAGFGDKAFQDFADGLGVVALFGDSQFDVYVLDPGNQEGDINHVSETLIEALRSKL